MGSSTYENQHTKTLCLHLTMFPSYIWKNRGKNKTIILIHLMHNLKTMRILKAQWNPFFVSNIFSFLSPSPTPQRFMHYITSFLLLERITREENKTIFGKTGIPLIFRLIICCRSPAAASVAGVLVITFAVPSYIYIYKEMNTHDYSRKPCLLLIFAQNAVECGTLNFVRLYVCTCSYSTYYI